MKATQWVVGLLMLILCAGVRADAQWSDANSIESIKTKAEKGDATAQYNLGQCYDEGLLGVVKDMGKAMKWWQKAAEQGYALAEYNLGVIYDNDDLAKSHGVSKNSGEAVSWFRKAAEQGYAGAQRNLGTCYYFGDGVPKDFIEAAKWKLKAANQGDIFAEGQIGLCYEDGDGVPKNYIEAYKWYSLAAAQGNEDAKKYLSIVEMRMTPDQIAEAQRLAAAFIPQKETPDSNSNSGSLDPNATGTGFFITDDGYLISNFHVVKDATKVRLLTSAGTIDAKVVQTDAANDITLLKAEGKFSSLPILPSRSAGLGDTVFTLGFPDPTLQGFAPKLAKGEIASLSGAANDARYFQVSVPVQPGNSGGALVDGRGNVIGIVSAKLDAATALAVSGALPENVNYAVKSSFLLSFLESVPDVTKKLKSPNTADEKFSDAVKSAQVATVLVLVY
ncbi:MAG TPA: tetratricopeptide repeat-containing serine protease family protein [Verrucomicrobiae bacterium]|nr:tetratricopeptide repeat-containing serine protease family protein [Verrucomicrobiae bacterium]